jgi:hypothetical protein
LWTIKEPIEGAAKEHESDNSLSYCFLSPLLVGGAIFIGARTLGLPTASVDETTRRGDVLVQALNKYRADHGRFPRSLAELSPQYLKEIPQPDWGLRRWIYEPSESDFYLKVNETEHTGDGDSHWLRYEGEKSGWRMGD